MPAVTVKYNAAHYTMAGYVTTYYSYFCVTLFIALLMYVFVKISYKNKYVKATVIAAFAFLIFCVSIITGYSNDHLSRDWQLSNGRGLIVKELLNEKVFDEIPNDAVIYMPDFNQTFSKLGRGIYSKIPNFLIYYINLKNDKPLKNYQNFENFKNYVQEMQPSDIYYITKYETQKSTDILIVISKTNSNSINFENEKTALESATANEATVYYYSANKNFTFQFIIPQCGQDDQITVVNKTQQAHCGINAIEINNHIRKKAMTSFTLNSDAPFLVKDFAISNIGSVSETTFNLW
jgi:hypothetical protein